MALLPRNRQTEGRCQRRLSQAGKFIETYLGHNEPGLVYCEWDRDRTGLVLASHLVRSLRLAPREAIKRVRQAHTKALSALDWEETAPRLLAAQHNLLEH